jgi:hypothetical protein
MPPLCPTDLVDAALAGDLGPSPDDLVATSVFGVHHGTRLAGAATTFENRYLLVRVGAAFGACAVGEHPLDDAGRADLSGRPLAALLRHPAPEVRLAALDAYLGSMRPFRDDRDAVSVELPAGSPEERAAARDAVVAELLGSQPGRRIALIGVVNPLIAAIRDRGCTPLPCDLWLRETAWGDPVAASFEQVVPQADAVLATGMTLGNQTFAPLARLCADQGVPLALYAQTGAAVARALVGGPVEAACCEPFPFSQFSADPTRLHLYHAGATRAAR